MNNSIALGFYAKHPLIMDELYELLDNRNSKIEIDSTQGLPDELIEVVKSNSEILVCLLKQVDKDLAPFEQMYLTLWNLIEKGALVPKRKQGLDWGHSIYATSKDRRQSRAKKIQFGWYWSSVSTPASRETMYVDTWLWMKGSGAAEKFLLQILKKLAPKICSGVKAGAEIREHDWGRGTVRLDRINVSERVSDDFSLDVEALQKDVWKSFSWVNEKTLSELFEKSRDI